MTIDSEEFRELIEAHACANRHDVSEAYSAIIAYIDKREAQIVAATVDMCAEVCDGLAVLFMDKNVGFDCGYTMAAERSAREIRAITPDQVLAQLALNANKEQS